jgi:hypothetical protein
LARKRRKARWSLQRTRTTADIVALSFFEYFGLPQIRDALARLRGALPPHVELWCGGAGAARVKSAAAGVLVVAGLTDVAPQLARWREARS